MIFQIANPYLIVLLIFFWFNKQMFEKNIIQVQNLLLREREKEKLLVIFEP